MQKIPTLFKREFLDHHVINISPEVSSPDLAWVLAGEGIATEKIDGACCAIIDGQFYKRYDAKKNKKGVPDNIRLFFIPPYTPEMNPIEQIWKEIRLRGFRNQVFPSLNRVVDRLSETIGNLSSDTIRSIAGRHWIIGCFD